MLSSVAKAPPPLSATSALPSLPPPLPSKPKQTPPIRLAEEHPTPAPLKLAEPKRITLPPPVSPSEPASAPDNKIEVRLPAKKTNPLPRLETTPSVPITPITMPPVLAKGALQTSPLQAIDPTSKKPALPPPLPPLVSPSAKSEPDVAKKEPAPVEVKSEAKPGIIKVNPLSAPEVASEESIFPVDEKDKSPIAKEKLAESEKRETPSLPSDAKKADTPSSTSNTSAEVKPTPALPTPVATPREPVRPPPLPLSKPAEKPAASSAGHVPPLLDKSPAPHHAEKLQQPHVPGETTKEKEKEKAPDTSPTSASVEPVKEKESKESTASAKPTPVVTEPAKPSSMPESSLKSGTPAASSETKPKEPEKPAAPAQSSASTSEAKPDVIRVPIPPEAKPAVNKDKPADKSTPPVATGKLPVAGAVGKSTSPAHEPLHVPKKLDEPLRVASAPVEPATRSARARKKRKFENIAFFVIAAATGLLLYWGGLFFGHETRIEGQVIPLSGQVLNNEVLIVTDFRGQIAGIVDDLARDRDEIMRNIHEDQDHVQRAQADVAAREERIRLIREKIQAAKDEITSTIKKTNDAAQQIWDGPGAELDTEYHTRLTQLQKAIADRAKALGLKYEPDPAYDSPEVWANAYRLALYGVTGNVDSAKEHEWLEDQMKQWRDFTKSVDDRQKQLREQFAQIKLSPTSQVSDLNAQIEEMQHRIDATVTEEEPLKVELQQAQADLAKDQAIEAGLDDKRYRQLYAQPDSNIIKRLPLNSKGRFSWRHVEKDQAYAEGEKTHTYFLLTRAVRPDGRQYWAFCHVTLVQNDTLPIEIDPSDFMTTKAILRPELSPDEQQQ